MQHVYVMSMHVKVGILLACMAEWPVWRSNFWFKWSSTCVCVCSIHITDFRWHFQSVGWVDLYSFIMWNGACVCTHYGLLLATHLFNVSNSGSVNSSGEIFAAMNFPHQTSERKYYYRWNILHTIGCLDWTAKWKKKKQSL